MSIFVVCLYKYHSSKCHKPNGSIQSDAVKIYLEHPSPSLLQLTCKNLQPPILISRRKQRIKLKLSFTHSQSKQYQHQRISSQTDQQKMASVTVYGPPLSTAVSRVLACLLEKDIQFQLVPVDMAKGQHKSPDFLKIQVIPNFLITSCILSSRFSFRYILCILSST